MSGNLRLTADGGALLVVDMQEKLLAKIRDRSRLIDNVAKLARAAGLLGIPTSATEQYPKGLGPTTAELAELIPVRPEKLDFHACNAPGILEGLRSAGIRHVTLAGIETHICVAQTALELLDLGFRVQVPADAVASREGFDWEFALRRMEHAGVAVTSLESALFEWTATAAHPRFKAISALVTGPARADRMGFPVQV